MERWSPKYPGLILISETRDSGNEIAAEVSVERIRWEFGMCRRTVTPPPFSIPHTKTMSTLKTATDASASSITTPPPPPQVQVPPSSTSTRQSTPYAYYQSTLPIPDGIVVGNRSNPEQSPINVDATTRFEQQQQQQPNATSNQDAQYRGFSSSITDMFTDEQYERVDCCAIACCGVLQHDRDRYLVTGVTPPSIGKRLVMHVCVPLTLFFAAGVWAMRVPDVLWNEVGATCLLLLLVVYFVLQCAKGRAKRIAIRKDLLYTKYKLHEQRQQLLALPTSHHHHHPSSNINTTARASSTSYQSLAGLLERERPPDDDDLDDADRDCLCCGNCCWDGRTASNNDEREYYMGQSRSDVRSAHPCCLVGFYADDRAAERRNANSDTATTTLSVDTPPCRGRLCGHHVQCCGVCALAQEAREIEYCILPASYRRIDYITMEAVLNYYPAIYQNRHGGTTGNDSNNNAMHRPTLTTPTPLDEAKAVTTAQRAAPRFRLFRQPLSRLSYRLLQSLLLFWALMLMWCLLGSYYFWTEVLGQQGHVLQQHRFGIDDWIILIATFLSSFSLLYVCSYMVNRHGHAELSLDAIIKYFASGFFLSASLALFWEMATAMTINVFISLILAVLGIGQMDSPQTNWAPYHTDGTKSLVLDTILPTQLFGSSLGAMEHRAASASRPDFITVFGLDHPVFYTFYILVATFVVAGLIEELCKYFGFRMVEHPDFLTRHDLEEVTTIHHNNSPEECPGDDDDNVDRDRRQYPSTAHLDYSKQRSSIQSRGAAITLALVAVAIGFTCCENLVYIFLYAGESVELELGVLLERSFFPIHPILAAIQSIGVCQRELEVNRGTKLGHIILPAVLFHGLFDFCIVFISFMGKVKGQGIEEGDLRITNITELLSIVCCVSIMFASLLYLRHESGKQRLRLAAMDRQTTVDRSNLI